MNNERCNEPGCVRGWGHRGPHIHLEPTDSTPPETPYAKQRRRPESLLPPRAVPRASASASLITIACVVAGDDSLSVVKRAVFVAALSFVSWLLGYFTEPPRRRFRRDD